MAKYWDDASPLKDPDLKSLYDEIVAAQVQGDRIVPQDKPFSLADAIESGEASVMQAPPVVPAESPVVAAPAGEVSKETVEANVTVAETVQAGDTIKGDGGDTIGVALNSAPKGETVVVKVEATKSATPRKRGTKPTKPERRASAGKPAGKAQARVGRNRTPGRPAPDSPYSAKRAFWAANPIQITKQGPGIMRKVLDELFAAGKGVTFDGKEVGGKKPKPVTKKDLHEMLKLAFKDRDPAKMWTNLNNLLPCRLREHYNIHVWRERMKDGEVGYYLVGDGHTPQPGTSYGPREVKPGGKPGKKAKTKVKGRKKAAAK